MMHTPNQILKSYYGYGSFRPLQEEIINNPIKQGEIFTLRVTKEKYKKNNR